MNYRLWLFLVFCFFPLLSYGQHEFQQEIESVLEKLPAEKHVAVLVRMSRDAQKSDFGRARLFADQALQLAEAGQNPNDLGLAWEALGELYLNKQDYPRAMEAFMEGLKAYTQAEDARGAARCKSFIGRVFYLQNDLEQAEKNLKEALNDWTEAGSGPGHAEALMWMGDVFLAKGVYGVAQEFYRKSMQLHMDAGHLEEAAQIANNIGRLAADLGDYESALTHHQVALDLHSSSQDLPNVAQDLSLLTTTQLAMNDPEGALQSNASAFELYKELGDSLGMARSLCHYGQIHLKLGDKPKARSYLRQSAQILANLQPRNGMPELLATLADTYAQLGDYEQAFAIQKDYGRVKDVVFDQEKTRALLDLLTKYQSEFKAEEQQQQIAMLELQNASARKVRLYLLFILFLVLGLLGVIYRSYLRQKRDHRLLMIKTERIERQTDEIKRQNWELEDKNAQLDELNRRLVNEIADREAIEKSSFARDNFLAAMSHEMRTPINALATTTHLLLEENPRPDQVEHLRTLQFAANNLVVFINDILDFSKIEAGKLELDWRPFSPGRVLKEIEERFQVPMQEKNLKWTVRSDERIPNQLIGDPVRLNQILTNLVQACYNHTEEGEIRVEMHLLELNRSEATLEVLVSGSGKGLPEELLEGMFAQGKPSEEKEDIYAGYSTASLSLAITRRLINLQKGMVEVDNRPGDGTTFRVILPFKVAEDQDLALNKSSIQASKQDSYADLRGIRILFVEDNKLNQIVVQKLLSKLGIEVTTADDGEKALEIIEGKDFDLILMDIQMPVMDGYRTTAEIRKHPDPRKRDVPIIALTASAFLSEKEKAKLFGMNDHVGKPFSPEELLSKIRSCFQVYKRV